MNKKLLFVIVLLLAAVGFGIYTFISSNTKGAAGIRVLSTPTASVFLDDKLIGKTPIDEKYPAGEYVLKLIPEDTSTQAASWQGKIALAPSLLTYVKRDLGASEIISAGEILSLEKIPGNEAQIAIISTPDAATILIDGQEKGVTPQVLRDMLPGEHEVAVSSPGFVSRSVRIQVTAGYKLSVNFQLALAGSALPDLTPSPSATTSAEPRIGLDDPSKKYVEIKDTPTGFLRVRTSPSTAASEATQIKPGEKFELLEEKDGWYKIAYEQGKEGWISGRYATKL